MQYSSANKDNNTNSPRGSSANSRGQNTGSTRYREAGRGSSNPSGRGRGDGQKRQNVWAQKGKQTPQSTTPETEFMSKYGVDNSNDSIEAVTNQINTLSVQSRSTEHKQNTRNPKSREDRSNGNGAAHAEHDGQKQDRRKPRERRERQFQPKESQHQQQSHDENTEDEKERQAYAKTTKLSLAEFHSSVSTTDDSEDNGPNEPPSRILWVGNIGPDVSEEELEQEFGQFGKIESLRILHNRFCAFINFETEEAAREAKENLDNTIVGSQYIVIHYRKPEQVKPPPAIIQGGEAQFTLNSPSRALWVGNVSDEVAEEELLSEFERYGKIESIRVLRAKTCAFVNFTTVEEASAALHALQGKKLGNMAIKVNFGKPQSAVPKSLQPDPQQYLGGPNMPPGFVQADYSPYMGNVPPGMPPYGVFPPGYYPMMEGYQMYDPSMYDPAMYDPAMFIQYVPAYPQMYGMPGTPNGY